MSSRPDVKPKPSLYMLGAAAVVAYVAFAVATSIADQQERLSFICETLTPGMFYDERHLPRVEVARATACKRSRSFF